MLYVSLTYHFHLYGDAIDDRQYRVHSHVLLHTIGCNQSELVYTGIHARKCLWLFDQLPYHHLIENPDWHFQPRTGMHLNLRCGSLIHTRSPMNCCIFLCRRDYIITHFHGATRFHSLECTLFRDSRYTFQLIPIHII